MAKVSVKELLEAGAHFGHQTSRWNPKMKPYIFGRRNAIHIINLDLTKTLLQQACHFVKELLSDGKTILFVGTKKQAKGYLKDIADELGMPYVCERWLGGMLTNNQTVRQSIAKMNKYTEMDEDGTLATLSKKEQSALAREQFKLTKNLFGIKDMTRLPDAVFVIDPKHEKNAMQETGKLNIPVVGMVDTNCDPDIVDHRIPANDDSMRTIQCILEKIKESALEGLSIKAERDALAAAAAAKKKAEEEARQAEARRKSEELRKAKEKEEAEQKAKTDAIIADLEENKG